MIVGEIGKLVETTVQDASVRLVADIIRAFGSAPVETSVGYPVLNSRDEGAGL
jgi:hypothetical protein